jgi:hypothetical protein
MTDEVVKELYRSRWRRARETLGLVDPGQDGFATGGLGGHVPHLTVRLIVLPADPEVEAEGERARLVWTGPFSTVERASPRPFAATARSSFTSRKIAWISRRSSRSMSSIRTTTRLPASPRTASTRFRRSSSLTP